ncbi:Innexin eat-5 [Schistosoma japonicum]|nr:Innexin eat-5 [Schistosoma japonicum]
MNGCMDDDDDGEAEFIEQHICTALHDTHLPLQCWIPQEFSRSWEEYAEHYCWVTNTYFANVQSTIPPVDKRTTIIRYYQWATFVFIIQAAGFFLPCLIWRLLQVHKLEFHNLFLVHKRISGFESNIHFTSKLIMLPIYYHRVKCSVCLPRLVRPRK